MKKISLLFFVSELQRLIEEKYFVSEKVHKNTWQNYKDML